LPLLNFHYAQRSVVLNAGKVVVSPKKKMFYLFFRLSAALCLYFPRLIYVLSLSFHGFSAGKTIHLGCRHEHRLRVSLRWRKYSDRSKMLTEKRGGECGKPRDLSDDVKMENELNFTLHLHDTKSIVGPSTLEASPESSSLFVP
jgi:hypothetical protein